MTTPSKPKWIEIRNHSRQGPAGLRARWCESFACKLRGLTFRRVLPNDEALLLVESSEGRANTAIHMWFVFQPLGVVWLNSERRVVDVMVARPWRWYVPRTAARFVLEGTPELAFLFAVGDLVGFESLAPNH
ncbi:MAG: DUF192 domain-containing protein [Anaerolineales bacterium]